MIRPSGLEAQKMVLVAISEDEQRWWMKAVVMHMGKLTQIDMKQ